MASMVLTKHPVKYFTFTASQCSSPEEDPTLWKSSPSLPDQDLDILSETSILTTPTTPGSNPDHEFFSKASHKCKQASDLAAQDILEEDFGTFEDWLKWDDVPSTTSNDLVPSMSGDNLSSQRSTHSRTSPDDNIVFIEDPVSDSPLFQSRNLTFDTLASTSSSLNNLNLIGIPPRDTIFNSPPPLTNSSWHLTQQPTFQSNFFTTILSSQEEARLRSIAMPNGTDSTTGPFYSSSGMSSIFNTSSSTSSASTAQHINKKPHHPSSAHSSIQRPQRKRKSTTDNDTMKAELDADVEDLSVEEPSPSPVPSNTGKTVTGTSQHQGKKSSHNMIEKRYRNNLNDKIAELRDSVPSLRVMSKTLAGGADGDDEDGEDDETEDLQGLTPAHKLNKATILSKATEYIAHLEKRNAYLTRENAGLKARVDAFEILMVSRQQQQQIQQQQQQLQEMERQQAMSMGGGYPGQNPGGGFGGRSVGGGWMN